ncbi:hypothetical protein CBM2626_B60025 [Cupriavidus taiwanensis]|nr:hypothetical protein CBM2626_B60025 [Cupriavidus taiwanensis]
MKAVIQSPKDERPQRVGRRHYATTPLRHAARSTQHAARAADDRDRPEADTGMLGIRPVKRLALRRNNLTRKCQAGPILLAEIHVATHQC